MGKPPNIMKNGKVRLCDLECRSKSSKPYKSVKLNRDYHQLTKQCLHGLTRIILMYGLLKKLTAKVFLTASQLDKHLYCTDSHDFHGSMIPGSQIIYNLEKMQSEFKHIWCVNLVSCDCDWMTLGWFVLHWSWDAG